MYRTIDTTIWDDPWFADLAAMDKYLFLYLVTNRRTTAVGVFEITIPAMAFETGIPEKDVRRGLLNLAGKVVWYADDRVIWVRNFFRRQNKNASEKMLIGARHALRDFPPATRTDVLNEYPDLIDESDPLLIPVPYPSDTPTIPLRIETVTVTEAVTGKETVSLAPKKSTRKRNETWDALAAATGEPETKSEQSDFGKTVSELVAADATVEQIDGFPPWWWQRFPGAELTHRCFRGHWGKYLNGRDRLTQITDLSPMTQALVEFRRKHEHDSLPGLHGTNGNAGSLYEPAHGDGPGVVDTAGSVLPSLEPGEPR